MLLFSLIKIKGVLLKSSQNDKIVTIHEKQSTIRMRNTIIGTAIDFVLTCWKTQSELLDKPVMIRDGHESLQRFRMTK